MWVSSSLPQNNPWGSWHQDNHLQTFLGEGGIADDGRGKKLQYHHALF
jgi:hypothetical protein